VLAAVQAMLYSVFRARRAAHSEVVAEAIVEATPATDHGSHGAVRDRVRLSWRSAADPESRFASASDSQSRYCLRLLRSGGLDGTRAG
jgi:hypothetical protein